jgi:hypothetical protein
MQPSSDFDAQYEALRRKYDFVDDSAGAMEIFATVTSMFNQSVSALADAVAPTSSTTACTTTGTETADASTMSYGASALNARCARLAEIIGDFARDGTWYKGGC